MSFHSFEGMLFLDSFNSFQGGCFGCLESLTVLRVWRGGFCVFRRFSSLLIKGVFGFWVYGQF